MCGRLHIDGEHAEFRQIIKQYGPAPAALQAGGKRSREIQPLDKCPVLLEREGKTRLESLVWGLPLERGPETSIVFCLGCAAAVHKPFYRRSLFRRPAVVPVSGFYDWRPAGNDGPRVKIFHSDPEGKLLFLAGFHHPGGPAGKEGKFALLAVGGPNRFNGPRLPLLLRRDEYLNWLGGEGVEEYLRRGAGSVEKMLRKEISPAGRVSGNEGLRDWPLRLGRPYTSVPL